jgi:hypothetical protein
VVKGLNIFKKYFSQYPNNYIIIGGTACDILLNEAGFVPRATKDIDIILVVEALSPEFINQFWAFIADGNYQQREKSDEQREYYRFIKPANLEFPFQIELFSRKLDTVTIDRAAHLTPIPADGDQSSLSAILLNDDYYHYMIAHSELENGLHHASVEALICLKAKAFLEIKTRIENGSKEDIKHLRKHKADVFRLCTLLLADSVFTMPESLQQDVCQFARFAATDLPDQALFKEMGLPNTNPESLFEQFKKAFRIELNVEE